MSKTYLEKLLNGEPVTWKPLGEIATIDSGKLNAKYAKDTGKYPFFTYDYAPRYIDEYIWDTTALIICKKGDSGEWCRMYSGKFNAFQWMRIVYNLDESVNMRFLYYFLNGSLPYHLKSTNISLPYISMGSLKDYLIPIPPMHVQERVVEILDKFTYLKQELVKNLAKELELRHKQYHYYRDKLLAFPDTTPRYQLEEVFNIRGGYTPSKSEEEYWEGELSLGTGWKILGKTVGY